MLSVKIHNLAFPLETRHFRVDIIWSQSKTQTRPGHRTWNIHLLHVFSIKISRSIVYIGGNPFTKPYRLEAIDVSDNPNLTFIDSVLMDREITQIVFCKLSKSVDYTNQNTAKTICASTFQGYCKLTSIAIQDSLKEIRETCILWLRSSEIKQDFTEHWTIGTQSYFLVSQIT